MLIGTQAARSRLPSARVVVSLRPEEPAAACRLPPAARVLLCTRSLEFHGRRSSNFAEASGPILMGADWREGLPPPWLHPPPTLHTNPPAI